MQSALFESYLGIGLSGILKVILVEFEVRNQSLKSGIRVKNHSLESYSIGILIMFFGKYI